MTFHYVCEHNARSTTCQGLVITKHKHVIEYMQYTGGFLVVVCLLFILLWRKL